jgi:predicted nucleic acid-binding protein
MERYGDLPLGFADAAVVACAERNGGRILTFDRRDFDVVAADVGLTIVPR